MEDKRILSMDEFKKDEKETRTKGDKYVEDMAYNNGVMFGMVKQFFEDVNADNASEHCNYFFDTMLPNLFFAALKWAAMAECAALLGANPDSLRMSNETLAEMIFGKEETEEGESDDAAPELPGRTTELHEDGDDAASDGRGESGVADAVRPGEDQN